MVEHLLEQIMSPNTEMKTEVNICRSSHLSTFVNHPLTCIHWLQDSIHLPTLRQTVSESVVFMLLAVETVAEEGVGVSMTDVLEEDVDE